MNMPADDPFAAADRVLEQLPSDVKVRVCDIHAEANLCREVQNRVPPLKRTIDGGGIANVGNAELHARRRPPGQLCVHVLSQRIQHANLVTARQQLVQDMPADEACSASEQDFHRRASLAGMDAGPDRSERARRRNVLPIVQAAARPASTLPDTFETPPLRRR